MDIHDQRKHSASGHENHGFRVCHRCGWPFPKPHPSAKHRRAHKRICGTIEGYRLTDLEEHTHLSLLDVEHLSNDDSPNPSPKIEKRSFDETGSGAIGEMLTRSEDEVFSDAKADFSESGFSPGTGDRLDFAKEPDKTVGKVVEIDINSPQQLKVDPTADVTESLKSMMKSNQINNPEVLECASNIQEDITILQDSRSEEVLGGLNSMNRSPSDLSPSKSEIAIHELSQDINAQDGDNGIPISIMCPKEDPEVKRDSEYYSDEVLNIATEPDVEIANKEFDGQSKLQKTNGIPLDPVTEDGIEQLKHGQKDGYIGIEVKPIEDTEAGARGTLNEPHSAKDIMCDGHEKLVEVCEMKREGKEEMHVLYVDNILPVADHPETLIEEDSKDHSLLKSNLPLTLGSDEEIRSLAEKNMDTKHAIAIEVKPVEDKQAGVGNVLVEAKSAQEIMGDGHEKLIADSNMKGQENMHVLRVDNILPVADNPEKLIEDFKDHRLLKSSLPLTLGSGKEVRPLSEKNMDTKPDITTKAKLARDTETGVDNMVIVTDSAQDIMGDCDYKLVEACNMKGEGKEHMHVIHMDNILPVADRPETFIEDFKYHRLLKSNLPLALDSNEEFGSLAEKNADTFDKESSSNSCSIRPGGISDSPADKNVLKHNIREEADTSQVKITNSKDVESNGMESSSSPSRCELKFQTKDCIEGLEPHFYKNESTVTVSDHSTIDDDKTSNLTGSENVEIADHGLDKSEDFDRGKNEQFEGVAEGKFSDCHMQIAPKSLENFSVSEVGQVTELARGYDRGQNEGTTELSDIPESEGEDGVAAQKKCPVNTETAVKFVGQLLDQACSDRVPDLTRVDFDKSMLGNLQTESITSSAAVGHNNSGDIGRVNAEVSSEPMPEEENNKHTKQQIGASTVDISVDSSSQTDSLEGNWGSVSVFSTQSDAIAATDTKGLPLGGSLAPEDSESAKLQKLKTLPVERHSNEVDVFEAPSFMTLVESGDGGDKKSAFEGHTVRNTHQSKLESSQAGWFPSISNVVNESPGRKKNEEIIAKVTNWSAGKQYSPLKKKLGEAKVETKPTWMNSKQMPSSTVKHDDDAVKNSSISITTVGSILESHPPPNESTKGDLGKEWNSPARYPIDTRKEKKKVRGKTNWVPFICCSSVQELS